MLLADLVGTSAAVADTSGRLDKIGYEHGPLPIAAYGPEATGPDVGSADVLRAAGHAAAWFD